MTWTQAMQAAVMWGPGILILVGIFVLVRRPPEFVGQFIKAQESQAVAMSQMATAVEDATKRDNNKLEEILVGVQLVLHRQEMMERRLDHGSG
ncbi:MAG: hypothetical protein ABSD47_01175 [Candidatus Methylomirabilota bacterium]|jgi:Na+(H+)/acetate symporter ActP